MEISIAVITVSDRSFRGEREDISGKVLSQIVGKELGKVIHSTIIPDEKEHIRKEIIHCVDELKVDVLLTTGGTGISDRDVTSDVTEGLIEKEIPGIPEIVRVKGFEHTQMSILSRGKAGIRGKTIIVNLPGSPKGVEESLGFIIPALKHGVEIIKGICKE